MPAFDEPAFDPVKYWRGPIWVNMNWMIHHGLRRYGRDDLAERVKADTLHLLETVGMFEYFDARPADAGGVNHGLGTDHFSWSAALLLYTLGALSLRPAGCGVGRRVSAAADGLETMASMGPRSANELLLLPVQLHGIRLGRPRCGDDRGD